MKKVLIILAEGFEEIEATISIDILRRAGLEVIVATVEDSLLVRGSRQITLQADIKLDEFKGLPDAIILPGGVAGVKKLAASDLACTLVKKCAKENKIIAAICAAPAYVLNVCGILEGKKATCYPGNQVRFGSNTAYIEEDVVIDGNIITSAGVGTVFDFALAIIRKLLTEEAVLDVKEKTLIK